MKWSERHIKQLQETGKIVSAKIPERNKNFSSNGKQVSIPRERPKAIAWLDLNLAFWANENCLTLEKEHKFSDRKFAFDYSFPAIKIGIEYNGGIFMVKSGHSSVSGLLRDSEKQNLAVTLGWRVLVLTPLNYQTVLKSLNDLLK